MLVCLVPDESKAQTIVLGLSVNSKEVFEDGTAETWSRAMLVQRILKEAGDSPITSYFVKSLKQAQRSPTSFLLRFFRETRLKLDMIDSI